MPARPPHPPFAFRDPGQLVDRELSLVPASHAHADAFLDSMRHPACNGDPECDVSRDALMAVLEAAPHGRERFDPRTSGCAAAYRFWMRTRPIMGFDPPTPFAGRVTLRIGNGLNISRYFGNLGYVVFPPHRGRHLAERAVRLILPLAAEHGMQSLWITTNPTNEPSRRTCERLGATLVDIVDLPPHHPLYARGERQKCRYRLTL